MSGTTVRSPADLDAEGDWLGAEFRLGPAAGAWLAKRWSPRLAGGALILMGVAFFGFILPTTLTGFGQGISAVVAADVAVFTVAAMTLPPRWRAERLYRYTGGIVLRTDLQPEPEVMRWADLESMTLTTRSTEDGDDYVSACKLCDRTGRAMTVRRTFGAGAGEIIATAERVLAPRLVRDLLSQFYAGEPASVGRLTVDQAGITCAGTSPGAPEWRIPWAEAQGIDIRLHGQQVTVRLAGKRSKRAVMTGVPNSFAVRYLIEHAARQAGVPVTADDAAWDPETPGDTELVNDAEPADDAVPAGDAGPSDDAQSSGAVEPASTALPAVTDVRAVRRYYRSFILAVILVLVIEGTVIGYLFATRPYPPVVSAVAGDVLPVTGGTYSVAFTPDGRNLIYTDGGSDFTEAPVPGGTGANFNGPDDWGAVVSPDGKTVAAVDGGTRVDLFNAATHALNGSLVPRAGAGGADIECLAYSPDGRWLAGGDRYGDIYVWNTATGAQRVLKGAGVVIGEVQAIAFSPDDTTIALGDSDGDITLWDAATGAPRGTLADPDQPTGFLGSAQPIGVQSLSFAAHGSLLAAADGNGSLYLWDASGQSLVATFTGNDPVTAAALNPAGTLVAGGTAGGETYLWDVPTQQQIAVLGGQDGGSAEAVTFSRDGAELAVGGESAIALWSITVR